MRFIRSHRIRPWFLYTPPVVACNGLGVERFGGGGFGQLLSLLPAKFSQYSQLRRGKSRNKVAVGEPAAGSFSIQNLKTARGLIRRQTNQRRASPHRKKIKRGFFWPVAFLFFSPFGQHSAMDNWVRCSMKDAAKCVNCHDLQIPES